MAESRLTFNVETPDGGRHDPVWVKVNVKNATCPKCKQIMVVVNGSTLYAFCPRCQQYFVPQDGQTC
jgi:NMD protein affecting ribosome stability and mRNA decay